MNATYQDALTLTGSCLPPATSLLSSILTSPKAARTQARLGLCPAPGQARQEERGGRQKGPCSRLCRGCILAPGEIWLVDIGWPHLCQAPSWAPGTDTLLMQTLLLEALVSLGHKQEPDHCRTMTYTIQEEGRPLTLSPPTANRAPMGRSSAGWGRKRASRSQWGEVSPGTIPRASGDVPSAEEGEVVSARESERRPLGGRDLVGNAPRQ